MPEGLTSISQSDGCNDSRGFKVRVQWTRAGIGVYHVLARKSYDWWGFSTYLKEGTTTHPRFFFSICCDVQQTSQAMGLLVGLSVTLLSNSRCGRCMELLKQRETHNVLGVSLSQHVSVVSPFESSTWFFCWLLFGLGLEAYILKVL